MAKWFWYVGRIPEVQCLHHTFGPRTWTNLHDAVADGRTTGPFKTTINTDQKLVVWLVRKFPNFSHLTNSFHFSCQNHVFCWKDCTSRRIITSGSDSRPPKHFFSLTIWLMEEVMGTSWDVYISYIKLYLKKYVYTFCYLATERMDILTISPS